MSVREGDSNGIDASGESASGAPVYDVNPFDQLSVERAEALTPRITAVDEVFDAGFVHLEQVHLELPNGHTTVHTVVRHPGAVGIVPLDDDMNVMLEYQHRTAADEITVEIPAGKLDEGESPIVCAKRELSEETGYEAAEYNLLTVMDSALGYSDERIHLFVAQGLVRGPQHTDEDEFVDCLWMPLERAISCVMAGTITDSKSIIALLMTARRLGI